MFDKNGNRVKRKDRGTVTVPARWMGYNNESKKDFELTHNFVADNFSPGFISQVKHLGSQKGRGSYIQVPPGDSKRHTASLEAAEESGKDPNGKLESESIPKIHYRQKEGDRTCLVDCFCNALHHMGYRQVASLIYTKRKLIVDKCNTMSRFLNFAIKASGYLVSEKLELSTWNIWDVGKHELVLVQLRGSDGKEDHVVCLAGGWLFDSNFDTAMRLSRETLDLCCSSDDSPNDKFDGIVSARVFPEYSRMRPDGPIRGKRTRRSRRKR